MPALGTPGGTSVMFPPLRIPGLQHKLAATGMGLAFFEPLGHPQNIWEQKGNENEHHPFLVAHPS